MSAHLQIIATLAAYFAFSAFAGALPAPLPEQERAWYGFVWRFIQHLAANGHRLVEARLPGLAAEIAAAEAKQLSLFPHPEPAVPAAEPEPLSTQE